jgi:hypothetical protein
MDTNTPFEELFLEENFDRLEEYCQRYAELVKKYMYEQKPLVPSLLAADLGLTVLEYAELVDYFNNQYQDDVMRHVIESRMRGEQLDFS